MAILIALILSSIIAALPCILSQIRLPGNMTFGGSNSKVISAACHCELPKSSNSALTNQELFVPSSSMARICDDEANLLRDNDPADANSSTDSKLLYQMSLQKLKWGEITEAVNSDGVGHLGFGTEDQDITAPVEGRLYT
jgi:hypothetical protein